MDTFVDMIAPVSSQTNVVTTATAYQMFHCASDGTEHVIFEDVDEAAVQREIVAPAPQRPR